MKNYLLMTVLSLFCVQAYSFAPEITTEKQFLERIAYHMTVLSKGYLDLQEKVAAGKNDHLLNKGMWYAVNYLKIIEKKHTKRHKFLRDRFSTKNGYVSPSTRLINNLLPNRYGSLEGGNYLLHPSATPSDVVKNIGEEELIFIDCTMAMEIAFYRALLDFFPDHFDAFFKNLDKPFLSKDLHKTPLIQLLKLSPLPKTAEKVPGSYFYIANHHLYPVKHFCGIERGYNLIVIGVNHKEEPLLTAFGLSHLGLTEKEIQAGLKNEFNRDPLPVLSGRRADFLFLSDAEYDSLARVQGILLETKIDLRKDGHFYLIDNGSDDVKLLDSSFEPKRKNMQAKFDFSLLVKIRNAKS